MRRFLAVLSSVFHSFLFCTSSLHPIPQLVFHPSLLTSCHLFLGLPISIVVSKFILKTFCGGRGGFCSLPFSVHVQTNAIYLVLNLCYSRFFLTIPYISLLVTILQLYFSLSYTGPNILLCTFPSKMFICFLYVSVSIQVSDACVTVSSNILFFNVLKYYLKIRFTSFWDSYLHVQGTRVSVKTLKATLPIIFLTDITLANKYAYDSEEGSERRMKKIA